MDEKSTECMKSLSGADMKRVDTKDEPKHLFPWNTNECNRRPNLPNGAVNTDLYGAVQTEIINANSKVEKGSDNKAKAENKKRFERCHEETATKKALLSTGLTTYVNGNGLSYIPFTTINPISRDRGPLVQNKSKAVGIIIETSSAGPSGGQDDTSKYAQLSTGLAKDRNALSNIYLTAATSVSGSSGSSALDQPKEAGIIDPTGVQNDTSDSIIIDKDDDVNFILPIGLMTPEWHPIAESPLPVWQVPQNGLETPEWQLDEQPPNVKDS